MLDEEATMEEVQRLAALELTEAVQAIISGTNALAASQTPDELQECADRMVEDRRDRPELLVGDESFEWLDVFTDSAQYAAIKWFHELRINTLLAATNTLELYVELAKMVGARAVEADRIDPGSLFFAAVGGERGGQLGLAIKQHYYHAAAGNVEVAPSFLLWDAW